MQNGIFKLDLASVSDAVLTAVTAALVIAAVQLVSTAGFDAFTADWGAIAKNMLNLGLVVGVGSLGRDLLSTNQGSFLGVGPANLPTPPQA